MLVAFTLVGTGTALAIPTLVFPVKHAPRVVLIASEDFGELLLQTGCTGVYAVCSCAWRRLNQVSP